MFDSVYSSKRIKQCLFTQIRELRSGWNAARLSHCYLAVGEVQAGGRVDECLRTTTTTKSATAALEIKILWHKSILFINQIGILSPLLYIHTYFISHTKLIWMRTTNSFIDIEVLSHSRECIFFFYYIQSSTACRKTCSSAPSSTHSLHWQRRGSECYRDDRVLSNTNCRVREHTHCFSSEHQTRCLNRTQWPFASCSISFGGKRANAK